MVERYTIVDNKTVSFEGNFKPDDLFNIIKEFFKRKGYFVVEQKNYEEVYEHGIQVTIELMPFNTVSDYLKKEMKINILMQRCKEVKLEIDGVKQKYFNGKVTIKVSSFINTDLRSKWEGSGWLYFLRIINDKFIRRDWMSRARSDVEKDTYEFLEEVQNYLNMIRIKAN